MMPTTPDEWRDELQRLARPPGPGVAEVFWRSWLDQHRQPPRRRLRECARGVRMMSPLERAEYNEGRSLGRDAQALRMGRNSWYVVTPNAGKADATSSMISVRR